MNVFYLTGRLTKDCGITTRGEGFNVAVASVAVKRDFKNKQGEYETDFINVEFYNKQAEFLNKYCAKGDMVLIEGGIRIDKYVDKEGNNKILTKFIGLKVERLNPKAKSETTEQTTINVENPKQVIEENAEDFELPF